MLSIKKHLNKALAVVLSAVMVVGIVPTGAVSDMGTVMAAEPTRVWDFRSDASGVQINGATGTYQDLEIDATHGKFHVRGADVQVNAGTIISIPVNNEKPGKVSVVLYSDPTDDTTTLCGQAISTKNASAKYYKGSDFVDLVIGTNNYLYEIAVTELEDDGEKAPTYTKTYNLCDGSIITSETKNNANFTYDNDLFVFTVGSKNAFSYNGTHGVCFKAGNVITLNAKEDYRISKVEIGQCTFAEGTITVTAEEDSETITTAKNEFSCAKDDPSRVHEITFSGNKTSVKIAFDGQIYVPSIKVYAELIPTEVPDEDAFASEMSATLKDDVVLNFYLKVADATGKSVKFYNANAELVESSDLVAVADSDNYNYMASCHIAAQHVSDAVTAVLCENGEATEVKATKSVKDYLDAVEGSESTVAYKTLAASLETYGDAAKIYFQKGNLTTEQETAIASGNVSSAVTREIANQGTTATYAGDSLLLNSKISLRFYFTESLTDKAVTVSGGAEFTKGDKYVDVAVTAANLDTAYTVTIDGETSATQSAMGYARDMFAKSGTSNELKYLMLTLANYYAATK